MQNIFREFIFILFYRLRLVILVFLGVSLVSVFLAVTLPPVYRSEAKFSLTVPQTFDPLQQETTYDYRNRVRRYLQEQRELITSNRVLARVVEELYPGRLTQAAMSRRIEEIRGNLDVIPPGGESFDVSSVFIVEYVSGDPLKAAKTAKAIAENYILVYREMGQAKTGFSHSFFVEQTEKLYGELMAKDKFLREFETEHALALLEIMNLREGQANIEVGPNTLLTQFQRSYHDLQTELAGLQVSINALEREVNQAGIPAVLPEMEVTGRAITVFKNKVAQLQLQLNEMKPQFHENFEPIKQVEQELRLSVESLRKEMRRTLTAQKITAENIKAKISQLENVIGDLREKVQYIAREKATYESLKQEFNIAKENYTRAQAQMEQARMAQSLNQDKQFLTLIDQPRVPVAPYKPNRLLIIVGGLLAGIFLGIAAALTVDHFDHRMKSIYEIERHLNLPVLGSMPSI